MGNWLDVVTIGILVVAVVVEAKRGFGRAIFDLAAVLVAVRLAYMAKDPLSETIKVSANPSANQAFAFAVPFALLTVVLWLLGKIVYDTTLISAEVFEPLLGGLCGILVGITLAHALTATIFMGGGGENLPPVIGESALGTEFLRFETYHRVVEKLYTFHRTE